MKLHIYQQVGNPRTSWRAHCGRYFEFRNVRPAFVDDATCLRCLTIFVDCQERRASLANEMAHRGTIRKMKVKEARDAR